MINIEQLLEKIRPYVLGWVHPFHALAAPLTSASWAGNSFSSVGTPTQIDLSAVFGLPVGITAVLLYSDVNDSAALGTDGLYFTCGPSSSYYYSTLNAPIGGDVSSIKTEMVPCDANGDIWYRIGASGSNTMDIRLQIVGYWL